MGAGRVARLGAGARGVENSRDVHGELKRRYVHVVVNRARKPGAGWGGGGKAGNGGRKCGNGSQVIIWL